MVYGELALWALAFLGYLSANVGIVFWRDWRRAALVATASSAATITLILGRPSVVVDVAAVAVVYTAI